MLQRRLDLPDATVLVLQGIAFLLILASETLYGRFKIFKPKEETATAADKAPQLIAQTPASRVTQ